MSETTKEVQLPANASNYLCKFDLEEKEETS